MHDHPACGCGCGHDHHEHHHEHGPGCGCGEHRAPKVVAQPGTLSAEEENMLALLARYGHLPVVRFMLTSSQEEEAVATALAPVVINDPGDSMDEVKRMGGVLIALEDKGLITLDYDIPITGYDYAGYHQSELYQYFQRTVAESAGQPGFLFDTAAMDMGSMALTDAAKQFIQ